LAVKDSALVAVLDGAVAADVLTAFLDHARDDIIIDRIQEGFAADDLDQAIERRLDLGVAQD